MAVLDKLLDPIDNKYITPISGMDATFLYAETDRSPMHVGSVAIIEGSLEFKTFKSLLLSRIHQMPTLRRRLMFVPMSIDHPYWVDDPNFNIDMHLQHVALPKPGGWQQLRDLASHVFSEPLDRSRPLWSFTFVEGLDNINQVPKGSVAVISKIHHVAIDGMAGAGMLSLIFDMFPNKKEIPAPKPYKPKRLPNEIDLVMKSAVDFAKNPLKLPTIIGNTVAASVKTGMITRVQKLDLPTAPFTAPHTPLNGIISPQRKWNTAILDLKRVITLKKIMDTTVNDVILAICAGALRRYLNEKDKLPKKPLVAMVPISTRNQDDQSNTGNKISSMLVQLATNIEDPIERLKTIHGNTNAGKTYQGAMGAKTLSNLAEVVPFGVANLASRVYSRFNLSKMHKPVFNVVITNVPGPQMPIYLQGHKLHSIMGMAPIIDGMGLIITVLSYNGNITISPTTDANSMPDVDSFSRYLLDSANELEEKVLAYGKSGKGRKSTKAKPKSDKFINHIKKHLKNNPDFLRPNAGQYQLDVKGSPGAQWQLLLNNPPGSIRRGQLKEPDVTITIKDEHLLKIGTGELDFQTAFIQGRLKIKGDMKKGMKLAKILSLIPKI